MRLVIVTGMSGAGKSTALDALEDAGFFCIDNLPVSLIGKFLDITAAGDGADINKVAIGTDIRSYGSLENVLKELEIARELDIDNSILFLDASDEVLIKRYKETRRKHPLSKEGRLEDSISLERKAMSPLLDAADHVLDTSKLIAKELKNEINKIFIENKDFDDLFITILSFGFKYGIPIDSDLVFDVRFLPNPFYIDELRGLTGNDEKIVDYLKESDRTEEFLDKLEDMVDFLIPGFISEEKHQLVISIGCTGGRHRSVMVANELYKRLKKSGSYGLKIEHRDLDNDIK